MTLEEVEGGVVKIWAKIPSGNLEAESLRGDGKAEWGGREEAGLFPGAQTTLVASLPLPLESCLECSGGT